MMRGEKTHPLLGDTGLESGLEIFFCCLGLDICTYSISVLAIGLAEYYSPAVFN